MKNNKGMGIISLICIVFVIAVIIAISIYFARLKYNEAKVQTIKTDMLLVEWKIKSYIDNQTAEKVEEIKDLGTKVIDMEDDKLIKSFLEKNVIEESEYEKYYVLSDENLAEAKLALTNYEENYFLINYENYEVIVTGGCKISDNKILYKLSDIKQETKDESSDDEVDVTESEE